MGLERGSSGETFGLERGSSRFSVFNIVANNSELGEAHG